MSDDTFLNFSAAPIPTAQPKQKSQKAQPKTTRRTTAQSQTVYGEELFKAAWKPSKSIVICFHPYTKNYVRVSKDEHAGKFAIKYNINSDGSLLLYHFDPPLDFVYSAEAEPKFEVDDKHARFYGPYHDANEIKLKLISILRREVLMDKKQRLEELRTAEAMEKAERERLEDEKEKLTDELADAGILSVTKESSIEAPNNTGNEGAQEEKVLPKTTKEEKTDGAKVVKDRSGATIKLTPIVY